MIPPTKDEPRRTAFVKGGVTHAGPYVWVTWLTKLLAGEDRCWWKAWYKAHHKYEKTADDPERAEFFQEWTRRHDGVVERVVKKAREAGWLVKVEEECAFTLNGSRGDLAGKPDVVAIKTEGHDNVAVVIDAKGGRKRASDTWQVLLYLFALPLSWLRGHRLLGRVVYGANERFNRPGDEALDVPELSSDARGQILSALRNVMGNQAPPRVPSWGECRFCDVAACPDRVTEERPGDARQFF